MPKPPRQFRHPRSLRQRGFFKHNTDIITTSKPTPCPECGFTIPTGELMYRNPKDGRFLCVVCMMGELKT